MNSYSANIIYFPQRLSHDWIDEYCTTDGLQEEEQHDAHASPVGAIEQKEEEDEHDDAHRQQDDGQAAPHTPIPIRVSR